MSAVFKPIGFGGNWDDWETENKKCTGLYLFNYETITMTNNSCFIHHNPSLNDRYDVTCTALITKQGSKYIFLFNYRISSNTGRPLLEVAL